MPLFVRILSFPADDPHRLEVRPSHREFVAELVAAGAMRMSGPFVGDTGAVMVFDAPDRAAVEALIARDPYTVEGVQFDAQLHEWNVVTPLPTWSA